MLQLLGLAAQLAFKLQVNKQLSDSPLHGVRCESCCRMQAWHVTWSSSCALTVLQGQHEPGG